MASPDAVPLFSCVGRNFRYAHCVTTYLTFRRGWRAICAHSRCWIQKAILYAFLLSSPALSPCFHMGRGFV